MGTSFQHIAAGNIWKWLSCIRVEEHSWRIALLLMADRLPSWLSSFSTRSTSVFEKDCSAKKQALAMCARRYRGPLPITV